MEESKPITQLPGYLPEKQIREIFQNEILPAFFSDVPGVSNGVPQAVLLGGQPGAGKSFSMNRAAERMREETGASPARLDVDAMREFHPKFHDFNRQNDKTSGMHTSEAATRWFEMAIEHGIASRCNMVIEGTFKHPDRVANQAKLLRQNGYGVAAEVVSTPYAVSKLSVQLRYEEPKKHGRFGRLAPTESHDGGYRGCPETLRVLQENKLVDSITVSRRDGVSIYENKLGSTGWLNDKSAADEYILDRERKLERDEALQLLGDVAKLHQMLSREGRNPAPSDIASAHAHTYLTDELLRKSGFETYQLKPSLEQTAQGFLNELAAGGAKSPRQSEAYQTIIERLDDKHRPQEQGRAVQKEPGFKRRNRDSGDIER